MPSIVFLSSWLFSTYTTFNTLYNFQTCCNIKLLVHLGPYDVWYISTFGRYKPRLKEVYWTTLMSWKRSYELCIWSNSFSIKTNLFAVPSGVDGTFGDALNNVAEVSSSISILDASYIHYQGQRSITSA